jgi:hypothetical protein
LQAPPIAGHLQLTIQNLSLDSYHSLKPKLHPFCPEYQIANANSSSLFTPQTPFNKPYSEQNEMKVNIQVAELSSATRVGAIRRLFFSPPCKISSFSPDSLSLASLFTPLTELVVLRGVWGGVVIGMPVMKLTFPPAAAIVGKLPVTNGGLLMIDPVAAPGA